MINLNFNEAWNELNKLNEKTDLTKIEGTYAKLIADAIQQINDMCKDRDVTANELRQFILKLVEPANDTMAKRSFIKNISNPYRNKTELMFYIYNVYENARGEGVPNNKPRY